MEELGKKKLEKVSGAGSGRMGPGRLMDGSLDTVT